MKTKRILLQTLCILMATSFMFTSCETGDQDPDIQGAEDIDIAIDANSTFNMTKFIASFEQGCILPIPVESVWKYEFSHDFKDGKATKSYAKDIRFGEFGDELVYTHTYSAKGVLTSTSRNNKWCLGGGADETYSLTYDKDGYISGFVDYKDVTSFIYNDDMKIVKRTYTPDAAYNKKDSTAFTWNGTGTLVIKSEYEQETQSSWEISIKDVTDYTYNNDGLATQIYSNFTGSDVMTYDAEGRTVTDGTCGSNDYYNYTDTELQKKVYSGSTLSYIYIYGTCQAMKQIDYNYASTPYRLLISYNSNNKIYAKEIYYPKSGTDLDGELELQGSCLWTFENSTSSAAYTQVDIWDENGDDIYTVEYPSKTWYDANDHRLSGSPEAWASLLID